MVKPELVIIRGLPGSGKSTMAKKDYPGHLHYEPDHLFSDTAGHYRFDLQLFDKAKDMVLCLVDFALARGENVVVSDVFPKIQDMRMLKVVAIAHGASVKVLTCTEQHGSAHRVPVTVMEQMREEFESELY